MLSSTIVGLDFSGAANAGEKIWVARATQTDAGLQFQELHRAADLPGGGLERKAALTALLSWLEGHQGASIGCDFPFALTQDALEALSWESWLLSLAGRFSDAENMRNAYSEQKRETDIVAKTPFAPLNLRLYRQTFHGLRDVLAPLVEAGARVVPFHEPQAGQTHLLEVCPASLLKREKLYLSYKGKNPQQALNRETILLEMTSRTGANIPAEMVEIAVANAEGDALDAVLAALITARVLQQPQETRARNALEQSEGRVYF